MHHVLSADEIALAVPPPYEGHAAGYRRADPVGRHIGAVHTGFSVCTLEPGGSLDMHVHSFEESFYVLEGRPQLTFDGATWELGPDECGLVPVGVEHAWRADSACRWLEAHSPAPREPGRPPDTFFIGTPAPQGQSSHLDIRDPRTRTFFRLGEGQMELDNLKIGAQVDAPTVSASMATALLAYSGIAVKMLVDQRLGAYLHQLFMVEYEPGGQALPHDHPLEEAYYIVSGEVEAEADGERFTLREGDLFWTGVGCIHAFYNTSGARVRWLETQAPQLPAQYSYRFNRDWDYLAERLRG
jgi:quercetin dioxygenase-like cupin family protein